MHTIAIHTSKGGVGKTTLTVNVSYELAARGYKVLVIDLDDQANSSLYLGVNKADEFNKAKSIEEFNKILDSFKSRKEVIDLLNEADIFASDFDYLQYVHESVTFNQFITQRGSTGRIDVLPGSYRTKQNEGLSKAQGIRETRLYRVLQLSSIPNDYDFVIIDTPPNANMVGINGLYAARYLLIPTQMEYFSVYGVTSVVSNIRRTVQFETDGQRGRILGIVPMMTDSRSNKINRFANQLLQQMLPDIPIMPEIKRTTNFATAAKEHSPISVFAEKTSSAGAAAMQLSKVVDEITSRIASETTH